MNRYSISVTVVYLLMCRRLKVGREDELAQCRLMRKGVRREKWLGTNDDSHSYTSASVRRVGTVGESATQFLDGQTHCCLLLAFFFFFE